jgi:hypothetical protein
MPAETFLRPEQQYGPEHQVRANAIGMQNLCKTEVVVDTDASIYPVEDIGLRGNDDYEVSVVSEFSLQIARAPEDGDGATTFEDAHAAMLKRVNRHNGEVTYGLVGLAVDGEGGARLASRTVIDIPRSEEGLTLGVFANSEDRRSADRTLVAANRLWGPGVQFGPATSRSHLKITNSADGIRFADTSTNGTMIRAEVGQPVQPEAAIAGAPPDAEPVVAAESTVEEMPGAPAAPVAEIIEEFVDLRPNTEVSAGIPAEDAEDGESGAEQAEVAMAASELQQAEELITRAEHYVTSG